MPILTKKQLMNRFNSTTQFITKTQETMNYHERIGNKLYNERMKRADKYAKLLLRMEKEKLETIAY